MDGGTGDAQRTCENPAGQHVHVVPSPAMYEAEQCRTNILNQKLRCVVEKDRRLSRPQKKRSIIGELPVSLSGPIANPTTRHLNFCSLVLSQLDSKLQ
jgi:hypothetical protein